MHGFGRVEVERDEPVFHARWERRVFGMRVLAGLHLGGNIDAGRHCDRAPRSGPLPVARLLRALARERSRTDCGRGRASARRARGTRGGGSAPAARSRRSRRRARPRRPLLARAAAPGAFAPGDAVRTRNHQPRGHTRLPAYARSRRGVMARAYPACIFPDTHAHGRGENPQYVYTVRFDGRELWGASGRGRLLRPPRSLRELPRSRTTERTVSTSTRPSIALRVEALESLLAEKG